MIADLFIIGIGGFFGSISRYLAFIASDGLFRKYNFPFGTLFVNIAGSFLIGAILALSIKHNTMQRGSLGHFLFVTGFLGAFTTFSTFSQDNLILLMQKHYWLFALNAVLSVILGLAFAALGYFIVDRLS